MDQWEARVLCPNLNLIPPQTPPDLYRSNLDHFLTHHDWTRDRLSAPGTIPFIPQCRNPSSPAHDQFFGVTLANPAANGLTHMLCFFSADDKERLLREPERHVERISTLFEIGNGLSGNPNILHGGATMSLVDEAMGALIELNVALGKDAEAFRSVSVTATLEIKFLQPVPTGQAVIATTWMESTERRKTRLRCEVMDEKGENLAKVTSTWVTIKPSL